MLFVQKKSCTAPNNYDLHVYLTEIKIPQMLTN